MEAEKFGDSFDASTVTERGSFYILVSELAALASTWCDGTISAALKLISSSFRSAYWLWLEDDDRAMAALRCTLEQAARITATHKNPRKVARLETRPTLPSRWLEAAGWRRLKVLNEALGEYFTRKRRLTRSVHACCYPHCKWMPTKNPDAVFTARRHALDLVSEFAARSTIDAIRPVSSKVADSAIDMLDTYGPFDLSAARKERIFNHAWAINNRS